MHEASVFSGRALGGEALVSEPDFYLQPYGLSDWSCIHSDVDHVDFETVFIPASATISPSEFYIDGFSVTSNGLLRLDLPYGEMSPVYGSVWIDTPPLAWGYLYDSWSIHRCSGGVQEFCYACGRHHAVGGDGDCSHAMDCEARRDVHASCSCAPIFVPVNWDDDDCNGREDREDDELSANEDETVLYRALGFARECCCDCSFGWESSLRNVRVSPSLRNWVEVNGPQVVDATPQELSDGQMQCGPASVSAIKRKEGGRYDCDFVFAEVAAKVRRYRKNRRGEWVCVSERSDEIGTSILTKSMGNVSSVEIKGNYK